MADLPRQQGSRQAMTPPLWGKATAGRGIETDLTDSPMSDRKRSLRAPSWFTPSEPRIPWKGL